MNYEWMLPKGETYLQICNLKSLQLARDFGLELSLTKFDLSPKYSKCFKEPDWFCGLANFTSSLDQ